MPNLYNQDFYAWTQEQARLLRAGCYAELNAEHLIEEIEDLGKRERRALERRRVDEGVCSHARSESNRERAASTGDLNAVRKRLVDALRFIHLQS